jgi:hypothetical protein
VIFKTWWDQVYGLFIICPLLRRKRVCQKLVGTSSHVPIGAGAPVRKYTRKR